MILICKHCGKEFDARNGHVKYCSVKCSCLVAYIKSVKKRSKKLIETGIENEDYVIDRWNGLAVKRLYGKVR